MQVDGSRSQLAADGSLGTGKGNQRRLRAEEARAATERAVAGGCEQAEPFRDGRRWCGVDGVRRRRRLGMGLASGRRRRDGGGPRRGRRRERRTATVAADRDRRWRDVEASSGRRLYGDGVETSTEARRSAVIATTGMAMGWIRRIKSDAVAQRLRCSGAAEREQTVVRLQRATVGRRPSGDGARSATETCGRAATAAACERRRGVVVEAKAQLVGIRDRVRSDLEGVHPPGEAKTSDTGVGNTGEAKRVVSAANPGPEDAADLLRICLQCGVPKTYTHTRGMICPICGDRPPADPNAVAEKKKGSTIKDKEKSKRMKGQSSHSSWKSETEMALRQQFD